MADDFEDSVDKQQNKWLNSDSQMNAVKEEFQAMKDKLRLKPALEDIKLDYS